MTNLMTRPEVGNRWLDPILEDLFSVSSVFDRRNDSFIPKANIINNDDKLIFMFEVPGMKKEDIKVKISNNILHLTGKKETRMNSEHEQIIRQEIMHGQFERQFTLPDSVQTDKINAVYENGMLTVELDKKEEVKPREIDVKIK